MSELNVIVSNPASSKWKATTQEFDLGCADILRRVQMVVSWSQKLLGWIRTRTYTQFGPWETPNPSWNWSISSCLTGQSDWSIILNVLHRAAAAKTTTLCIVSRIWQRDTPLEPHGGSSWLGVVMKWWLAHPVVDEMVVTGECWWLVYHLSSVSHDVCTRRCG